MSPTAALTPPPFNAMTAFRRLTVAEYQQLIDHDILTDEDEVELLEGYIVLKMPRSPPHDYSVDELQKFFFRTIPDRWTVMGQTVVSLPDSRPEPDLSVARGPRSQYRNQHPSPAELALVVEVADSSLACDRTDKGRIYARESIPVYWIVNVVDRQIEVYTDPTGPVSVPVYRRRQDYAAGSSVPVVLDGTTVGTLAVDDVLP